MAISISAPPEPVQADLDGIIDQLKKSWTSTLTVKRKSTDDVGYREIVVSLDDEPLAVLHHGDEVTREVPPGKHRLLVHNTLFRKTIEFSLNVGEHAIYRTVNRAGFLTYSVLAFFLGGGPLYLSVEREGANTDGR
jgi:hypothetical protein